MIKLCMNILLLSTVTFESIVTKLHFVFDLNAQMLKITFKNETQVKTQVAYANSQNFMPNPDI